MLHYLNAKYLKLKTKNLKLGFIVLFSFCDNIMLI